MTNLPTPGADTPMADILITKIRTGGNQMVRADTKGATGQATWINVSAHGLDDSIHLAREKAAEYAAIADELEKVSQMGEGW